MNAIILAAGKGTRMKHLTNDTPKSMLKIKNKPILEHILENLPIAISKVIIIIGYLGYKIKQYFGNNFNGREIIYVECDIDKLRGTGTMIYLVKNYISSKVLILMGDDLYHKKDLKNMIKQENWAVLAKEVSNPEDFGVLKFDNNGNIIDIIERPKEYISSFANTGAYLIDDRFFKYPLFKLDNGENGLPQTIINASKDIPVKIIKARFWHSNNKASDLKKAEELINIEKKILDSGGKATIETEINGNFASVPSGASIGGFEAKPVFADIAIKNILNIIAPELLEKPILEPKEFDKMLIKLDGTFDKSRLGANAILSLSL